MKKSGAPIREYLFYLLGILLILGFVALYTSRFLFKNAMPPLIIELFHGQSRVMAIFVNASVFILFLAFLPYRRGVAWRSKGAVAAFILALMAEMFGIPLMIYIFSPFLPTLFPDRTQRLAFYGWLSSDSLGLKTSYGLILGTWVSLIGMLIVMAGWRKIHQANGIVKTGIYRFIRHPQYTGLFFILTGWIIHWPTFATLAMYPFLLFAYFRLARKEEKELIKEFGEDYRNYSQVTPMFFPNLFKKKKRLVL